MVGEEATRDRGGGPPQAERGFGGAKGRLGVRLWWAVEQARVEGRQRGWRREGEREGELIYRVEGTRKVSPPPFPR